MTKLGAIVYSVGVTLQNADAFTNGAFVVIFAVLAYYLSHYRNYKNDLIHYKDKEQLDREWKLSLLTILEMFPRNKNANLKLNAKIDRMMAELVEETLKDASEEEKLEIQRLASSGSTPGSNPVIATEVCMHFSFKTSLKQSPQFKYSLLSNFKLSALQLPRSHNR